MTNEQQKTTIKNKFHHFIDGMIYLNKHHRSLYPDFARNMGLIPYLLNFGIVTVDIGRQIGKSTYILESATEKDLIICVNHNRKKDIHRKTKAKVMTYDEAKRLDFLGFISFGEKPFSTVYLDDFSFFGEKYGDNEKFYIDLLENLVSRRLLTKDSTIVRLG